MAKLSYVNIFARDIEGLSGFYRKVFGFAEIPAIRSPIFVGLDAGGTCIGFNAQDAYGLLNLADQANPTGAKFLLNIDVDSVADVDRMVPVALAEGAVLIKPPFALPAELRWRALTQEPFALLVPRAQRHDDWRALLKSEPFVRYDRNSFGGRLVERWLRKQRINVQDVVELDELQAIVELVGRGVGVALVPQAAALRIPKTVAVLPLDGEVPAREIGYVERAAGERPAAVTTFAECVAAAAAGA